MAPRKLHGVLLLLLQSLPPLLLLLPTPIAGQQSKAGMDFKSWPREDPGHLEGYCPTRGGRARDWMAGDLEGCTMLDLYSQGLNATTMTELSIILALHGTEVTWLELARQMLDDPEDPEYTEGVVATLEMLDANRQIHTARLGENRLGPAHAAVLAPALNGGSGLSRLLVDGNQFGAEGASALAAAIGSASAHIIELDLALNDLGDDGCIAIGKALVTSPSVTILSLEGNAIGAAGGEALKEAMAVNTQLERLVMRLNKLASAGVSAIAEGLSANAESGLLSVDFFGNSVGDSAVVALGAALQQPGVQLQELGLAKNNIGNDGAVALAEALQSRGGALPLRTLVLAANSIGDKGAAALLAAVKANAFLTTLDVRQHSTPSMKNLMKQVKPELACNAVLEQATGWESAADRVAVYKLVTEGQKQVEEIAKNWKPSVYRLGPTKPQPQSLGSVEACVAKAMRLKAGVEMALKSGGGKQPRAYTSRSYDDMSVEAAGGNGDGGGGASGGKEGKKTIEIDKDEL